MYMIASTMSVGIQGTGLALVPDNLRNGVYSNS